ncbi:MAG: T9SS type A sorting domain-containing protein [Flavobacteriales bacterium]|nr:T9SS type A sorting domain-containing protein [Flavobacteriales bacterium]
MFKGKFYIPILVLLFPLFNYSQTKIQLTGSVGFSANCAADWSSPGTVCGNNSNLDLNQFLSANATPGGSWHCNSHPGIINGSILQQSGIFGPVNITYYVTTGSCSDSHTEDIVFSAQSVAAWSNPINICANNGIINLNTFLANNSTHGGTWSSSTHPSSINDTILDPTNVSGTLSLTYAVGSFPCSDSYTQLINVDSGSNASASWTPISICSGISSIDLNTLLDSGSNNSGTWSSTSHPNRLNGHLLDVSNISVITSISLTYAVSQNQNCPTSETNNIVVSNQASAAWTSPINLCGLDSLDLTSLLDSNATAGGTWSSASHPSILNGSILYLSNTSGQISITYAVGSGLCANSNTDTLNVGINNNASWTNPGTLCQGPGTIDLNNFLDSLSTPGGTWSSVPNVLNGSIMDLSSVLGNVIVTYTIGSGQCAAIVSHSFDINASAQANCVTQREVCGRGPVSLSTLLSAGATPGGSWTGPGVNLINETFDPDGLSGQIILTYNVGSGPCADQCSVIVEVNDMCADFDLASNYCNTFGPIDLNALADSAGCDTGGFWFGPGVSNGIFNPSGLQGPITISHEVTSGTCTRINTRTTNITQGFSAQWTNPGTICVYDDFNLNQLLNPSTDNIGGTWSGQGVYNDSLLDVNQISGNIYLTYTVSNGSCTGSYSDSLYLGISGRCAWSAPVYSCSNWGPIDLNDFLTTGTSAGGVWSGPGINGSIFDPSTIDGKVEITYTYGTGACASSCSDTIFVNDKISLNWTAPTSLCENDTTLDLNTLIDSGSYAYGNWFVNGSHVPSGMLVPSNFNGNVNIEYSFGDSLCAFSESNTITILPSMITDWTSPGALCLGSGVIDLFSYLGNNSSPNGSWSGAIVTNSHFINTDSAGSFSITYSNPTGCGSTTHLIQIDSTTTAAWNNPIHICQTNGLVDLNSYLAAGTPSNGIWSAPGLIGPHLLDPQFLNGPINISYQAGNGNCSSVVNHTVTVLSEFKANWTSPGAICFEDTINLNDFLDSGSTKHGVWYPASKVYNDSLIIPGTVSGTNLFAYEVGQGTSCRDIEFHNIDLQSGINASWTPQFMCELSNPVNLNSWLDTNSTHGGTWAGPFVNGNTFNPNGAIGSYNLTYSVGVGNCLDTVTHIVEVEAYAYAGFQGLNDWCEDAGLFDLNTLIYANADTGGTWTGLGVTGHYFDPTGLGGQDIHIIYTVGTPPCQDFAGGWIFVKENNLNSDWNSLDTVPASMGSFDMNVLLKANATPGGTWSGPGISGNLFNPGNLAGTVQITYSLDYGVCESATTHNITVMSGQFVVNPNENDHLVLQTQNTASLESQDLVNSIPEVQKDMNIQIYPNPSSGNVNIRFEGTDCSIQLLDLKGRVLKQRINSNNFVRLNIEDISAGTYYIRVFNEHIYTVKELIIIH